MTDFDSEVPAEVRTIKQQLWLILLTATGPFLILSVAGVLTAEAIEDKLLVAATFIFGFGLALIATKVAMHTVVERHLQNIEKINEIKSDFIAVAAHQLKTPISAFTYTLDGLESAYANKDMHTVDIFMRDLRGSAHRLNLLTKNLLNVTLINNNASTVEMETFALLPQIEDILKQLEPVRELNSVKLDSRVSVGSSCEVYCDSGLFYHVLENLLTNALKYSEKSHPVVFQVKEDNGQVRISISNTTFSLEQSDIKTLFRKYKRLSGTMTTKSNGFGLGLYITKRFVESWGGQISVELDEANDVVTFSFTVQKAKAST